MLLKLHKMRVSLDHLTWGSSDALFIYEENLDGSLSWCIKTYSDSLVLDVILQNGIPHCNQVQIEPQCCRSAE